MSARAARILAERSGDDKFVVKTASCTLTVREQQVHVDSTDGAVAIALPNVVEAKGLFFSIICTVYVSAVTITAASTYDFAYTAISEATDGGLYYSDGFTWWELSVIT